MNLERLAALVEEVSGIVFEPAQLGFLVGLVTRRAAQAGCSDVNRYLDLLERRALEDEWRHLLPAITVKESFLFRVPEQFRALREQLLLPLAARRDGAPLRVWSAGCANGEEPATLAVVLAEAGLPAGSWSVLATDVDERALQAAQEGLFSPRAVSQVPAELLQRHFTRRGDRWALDRDLLAGIRFRRVNLVREPFPDLGGPFDVVLLRNVLIYFRPESQRRVVAAVADNLAADGVLFLGHSESLWQLTDRLEAVDLGGCFTYRHRPSRLPSDARAGGLGQRRAGCQAPAGSSGTSGAASAEPPAAPVRTGRAGHERGSVPGPPQRTPPSRESVGVGVAWPEPTAGAAPPSLAAAAAALRANSPETAAALVAARLKAQPEDPEAHALQGLVHDLGGDAAAALAAYRAALYLVPGLYQVRLLLADGLRRAGWTDRARTEYRRLLGELEAGEGADVPALADLLPRDREVVAARCRLALAKL